MSATQRRARLLPKVVDGEWFDGDGVVIDVERIVANASKPLPRRAQAMLAGAGLDPASDPRWHVLLIAPGQDNAVDKLLRDACVECWMPSVGDKPRRRTRFGWEREKQPALPGYLFVRVRSSAEIWAAMMRVEGVAGVIGGAYNPACISDDKYLKFRAKVDGDPAAIALLTNALKAGDRVIVDDGPFRHFPGVVGEVKANARAMVEVMIFGRVVPFDMELAQITKSE